MRINSVWISIVLYFDSVLLFLSTSVLFIPLLLCWAKQFEPTNRPTITNVCHGVSLICKYNLNGVVESSRITEWQRLNENGRLLFWSVLEKKKEKNFKVKKKKFSVGLFYKICTNVIWPAVCKWQILYGMWMRGIVLRIREKSWRDLLL